MQHVKEDCRRGSRGVIRLKRHGAQMKERVIERHDDHDQAAQGIDGLYAEGLSWSWATSS